MKQLDLKQIIVDPLEAIRVFDNDTWVGIDIETSGLSPWKDVVATIQLYGDTTKKSALLHVRGRIPDALIGWLSDPVRKFIGHNIVCFDEPFLSTHGVDVNRPTWFDTLIAEGATLSFGRKNLSISLKATLARHFDVNLDKDIAHGGWLNPELTPEQIEYAVNDVRYLPRLRLKQMKKAEENGMAEGLAVEMAVAPAVVRMIINGLPIDLAALRRYLNEQSDRFLQLQKTIVEELGPINVGSTKQLGAALEAKGRRLFRTEKGNYRTDSESLKSMADEGDDLCGLVITYREARQRLNMYSDEWIAKYVYAGRVHAKFKQVGTDTTRFSSAEPNLQQVPRDMRSVFGGLDGFSIVKRDYSQLEIRVAAGIAGDANLLALLGTAEDVHKMMGAEAFAIPIAEVTKAQRQTAKAVSFSILFGAGPDTVRNYARQNGSNIDRFTAKQIIDRFMMRFPDIHAMKETAKRLANRGGSVSLNLPGGIKRQLTRESLTMTRILNTAVQGTAAQGLKRAMIAAREIGLDQYFSATVHDELVSTVPDDEAADYSEALAQAMEMGMRSVVDAPIRSEGFISRYWQ